MTIVPEQNFSLQFVYRDKAEDLKQICDPPCVKQSAEWHDDFEKLSHLRGYQ